MTAIPDTSLDAANTVGTPALEVKGLTKSFPGVHALADVSFAAYPGEVHTLLGENGAGKSTLLKTVFGVQSPTRARSGSTVARCTSTVPRTPWTRASRWSTRS